jgi:hypothetical protein
MLIHINGIVRYILLSLGVFLMTTFLSNPIMAQTKSNLQEEGERLTRQFWETVKTKNKVELEKILAPNYQSALHKTGVVNKATNMADMLGDKIDAYELTGFNVAATENTLVVTYIAKVIQTIDGKTLPSKSSGRISVWTKSKSGWQLLAHDYLKSLF